MEGGCAPLGTLPAGHWAPLESCPEVVGNGLAEPLGPPTGVAVEFVFVAFEWEEFEPFMPGFVGGSLVFAAVAPDDAGRHGAAVGTFGVAGPGGCGFPGTAGVGDGMVVLGAGVAWPFVVWFGF